MLAGSPTGRSGPVSFAYRFNQLSKDPAREITVIENTPIDYLDFASPVSGLGSKIGLDATNKIEGETSREWGRKLAMSDDVAAKVDAMWERLGL